MPVCKAEAHRALELLEDYYTRLDENEERELKVAIERVRRRIRLNKIISLLIVDLFKDIKQKF